MILTIIFHAALSFLATMSQVYDTVDRKLTCAYSSDLDVDQRRNITLFYDRFFVILKFVTIGKDSFFDLYLRKQS